MTIMRDGTSLITAGLDHWFERENGENGNLDIDEFRIKEWRLQRQLGVDHFRLPPDYRQKRRNETVPNTCLTVPFLRFPQWHVCPFCKLMSKRHLSERGRIPCPECNEKGKKRMLVQVPFVAMCEGGHLQDFPWSEWAHYSASPVCSKPMRLYATGGASLAAQVIKCSCGAQRNLSHITEAYPDGKTFLTSALTKEGDYLCRGYVPWHGSEETGSCQQALRGSLRSASNVYYALTRSAIYIPRGNDYAPSNLVTLLENPMFSALIELLTGAGVEVTPEHLKKQHRDALQQYSDGEISAALRIVTNGGGQDEVAHRSVMEGGEVENGDPETAFRRPEFDVLRISKEDDQLLIELADPDAYQQETAQFFSRISLVHKLKETRALSGFSRVYPENGLPLEGQKALLWKEPPARPVEWLPAYTVFGEGIYFELSEERLQAWEDRSEVDSRVQPLVERYGNVQKERRLRERPITPRFVLIHTFAHLLMNRLTFDCGYSSAALRERLYVSENRNAPMAGVLIYTAAGDAEGTMGGLVRMGRPGYLEPVVQRALEAARWCSADPVCMEMGLAGGQGPDGCNLAACHNCSLVPETACEEFNRFLDRAVAVGNADNRNLGYFS